ncbi:hypothetical protein AOQ73_09780 [Bradyrhizobium pachyrhizi]|nr:hypothetical protein AOQ73_09780 [Bradyrhizobium pachyrhizi]
MIPGPRNIFDVVLAKARTHYPDHQLLSEAGATIPFTIKRGGYGSWLRQDDGCGGGETCASNENYIFAAASR